MPVCVHAHVSVHAFECLGEWELVVMHAIPSMLCQQTKTSHLTMYN